MTAADISVVVATYNRSSRLRRLVSALEAQTYDGRVELVVVDDASTDETQAVLADIARGVGLPMIVKRLERNRGPATARNVGWRAASGPVIAFTDDDCTPEPRWVGALADAIASADIVQGRTDAATTTHAGPFEHRLQVHTESGFYETCNVAYRRQVLESTGGFDERFVYPYGEDTDLAWRARAAGATTAFVDDAVVVHDVTDLGYRGHLREMRRREGLVMTMARHPDLRRRLGVGLFFRRSHAPMLMFVASTVAPLARPHSQLAWITAGAAGAWYLRESRWSTGKPKRKADWAWLFPLRFIADLYEIGVLARASVRHRTLLL